MKVVFRVHCNTVYGETVLVSGNTEELGNWSPESAVALKYVRDGWWEGTVTLKSHKGVEYKYIKRAMDGWNGWEIGRNREIELVLEEKEKEVGLVLDVFDQRIWIRESMDGASQTSLKIMTYNVRFDNPNDGSNSWDHRKHHVGKLVQMNAPDVVGFQEPLYHQLKDLEHYLKENYSWVGTGRDGTGNSGEFAPIFFNHHVFYIMDSGTFWISSTPDQPGSIDWDARCRRICTWAKLIVKSSQTPVYVFNTHLDHHSAKAREKGLELLFSKIYMMSYGNPAILCGDFNVDEEEPLITKVTNSKDINIFPNYMANSKTKSITPPQGPKTTFTGWDTQGTVTIDYILLKHYMMVYSYNVLEGKSEGGKYCSDHRPVIADILI